MATGSLGHGFAVNGAEIGPGGVAHGTLGIIGRTGHQAHEGDGYVVSDFILQPKKAQAQDQMVRAEQWFESGEYELALKGDGNDLGFEDIIDQFGAKGGQSVYMYAGVAKLHLGEYEEAISFLKKYKGEDPILLARAQSCIGDAYVGLEDYATALNWYDKAVKTTDNVFAAAYLLKAGIVAEEMGNKDKALAYYKEVKDKWPNAPEAAEIDKYISRIEAE